MRRIREAADLTQPEFARIVGVSGPAIQSIELGRLQISPRLARRIAYTFGLIPGSFEKRRRIPRCILGGLPYTPESYSQWQSQMRDGAGKGLDAFLSPLTLRAAELALLAASDRQRFIPVFSSLRTWIEDTMRDFGLEDTMKRLQKEGVTPGKPPANLTKGDLEELMGPVLGMWR